MQPSSADYGFAFKRLGDDGAGTRQDSQRPYSRIRVVANLRPDNATQILGRSTAHTDAATDLKAFSYALTEPMTAAGFGSTPVATIRHTNLLTKGELNNDARGFVFGFEILANKYLTKPKTLTDNNTIANDNDDTQIVTPDALQGGALQAFLLALIADDYVAYVQFGAGEKEYLGRLEFFGTAMGQKTLLRLDPLLYPEGWLWGVHKGESKRLTLGLELRAIHMNAEWVDDSTSPFADIATGLAFAVTGAKPGALTLVACQDLIAYVIVAKVGKK